MSIQQQQIITVNPGSITEIPGGDASVGILRAFAQSVRPECIGAYMEKAEKLFQMGF
jgi:predicted phosphodiesterase